MEEKIVPEYFDKKGLATYTGFSVSYISWLVFKRRIPHMKIGSAKKSKIMFKKEDVDKWLAEQRRL